MRVLPAVERWWRHRLVYPAMRRGLRNRPIDDPIDLQSVERLLILRHDRIGDMIVTTPIFRLLKEANPRLRLGVFASPLNAEIIRHHPAVDRIHIAHRSRLEMAREIARARREQYDVVLDFVFNRTTTTALLARLAAPRGITIGHAAEKYRAHFNRLLALRRTTVPMVEILAEFVEQSFGLTIDAERLTFDIAVDERSRASVDGYLGAHGLARRLLEAGGEPYLVFNLSATDIERRMVAAQAAVVANHLARSEALRVVLIAAPADRRLAEQVAGEVASPRCTPFPDRGAASLLEVASLIEGAAGVITPDTAIIHFAAASGTPVLGFFTPLQDPGEWRPYGVVYRSVLAADGSPVSAIPEHALVDGVDDFLRELVDAGERQARHGSPPTRATSEP
jgi:ADP-heptose:LPS heptosyltransferase